MRAHEEKGGRASQALGVELAREALRLEELGNRARGLLPGVLRVRARRRRRDRAKAAARGRDGDRARVNSGVAGP